MFKLFLLLIAISSYCFSYTQTPSLPDGINRRIGNELDSVEADYFGLFFWVKGFKSGTINQNNDELTFRIARTSAPDTVFTFSKKNSEYLEKYISSYEDIFTKPDVQKSIDWTEISAYLRPSNPIREAGSLAIELSDKSYIKRQVIWVGDSVLVLWKDDSDVQFHEIGNKIKVVHFSEIVSINNQPVSGNYTAFANNALKVKDHSFFVKMSPELRGSMANIGFSPLVHTGENKSLAVDYSDVKDQYFKRFTVGAIYYPTHFLQNYTVKNRIYRYGADKQIKDSVYEYAAVAYNIRRWGAEILYNINPNLSLGAAYSFFPSAYEATRPLTNDPVQGKARTDIISGTTTSLLLRYHPKPRDPILNSFEAEWGLSVGYNAYEIEQRREYSLVTTQRTVKGTAWEVQAQLAYSYFIIQNISFQAGVLGRVSTQIKSPEYNLYSQSLLLMKIDDSEIRANEIGFFVTVRFHI